MKERKVSLRKRWIINQQLRRRCILTRGNPVKLVISTRLEDRPAAYSDHYYYYQKQRLPCMGTFVPSNKNVFVSHCVYCTERHWGYNCSIAIGL